MKPATAPLATAVYNNVGVAKVITKLSGKLGDALGVFGFAAAVLSVARTAKAKGLGAAGAEALKTIDPTGGIASKLVEQVVGDNKPSGGIRELAKQQADERAAQAATTTGQLAAAAAAGYMDPRHSEYGQRIAASGLDAFYGSVETAETEARAPNMHLAGLFARDANGREPEDLNLPPAGEAHAVHAIAGDHVLTGFQLPHVREAALQARKSKQGY